ncbi:MAG TPA: phosphoglycerate mutase, partial [Candidatus Bipolaricaulota bacterium]
FGPHAVLLLPDHYTPVRVRTHVAEAVPFALYRSTMRTQSKRRYSEPDAASTGLHLEAGHTLMRRLIQAK